MQTKIDFDQKKVIATISGEAALTEVSFAIEAAITNFLGRKATRFECARSKLANGDCQLEFTALCLSGPMLISKVMSLKDAERQGFYPRIIAEQNSFLKEPGAPLHKQVGDGQHHHRGFSNTKDGSTTTVMVMQDTNPEMTIAGVSYGLSDMITGLFALGVNFVKWQGSIKQTELYIRHRLSDRDLNAYFSSRQDYDLTRKVKTLGA